MARAALAIRRSGAGASARDKNPSVVVKCDRSGSSSAVGERLAPAEADDGPVNVAQGLLNRKSKYAWHNAGASRLRDVHMPVGTERLAYIVVQGIGNDFLAADAEAGVPPGCLVEECTAVAVRLQCARGALRDVGNGHIPNVVCLAGAILQLLPYVQKKLPRR